MEHKLVPFATVAVLWALVTSLLKLICTLLKYKYIEDKNYAILAAMPRKRSRISSIKFRRGYSGWSVHMAGKFSSRPGYRRDLGNRVSMSTTSKFLWRREWRARHLGNPASQRGWPSSYEEALRQVDKALITNSEIHLTEFNKFSD